MIALFVILGLVAWFVLAVIAGLIVGPILKDRAASYPTSDERWPS